MEKEKSYQKPINLLLEIVFNKKDKKVQSIRTSDISTGASYNDLSERIRPLPAKLNPDAEKRVQIKIKLGISDITESNQNDNIVKTANSDKSIQTDETNEAPLKRMTSKVSLSINDETNIEETIYFDVQSSRDTVGFDINESNHRSIVWQTIFDQIKQKYNESKTDNRIVNVIHDLIMEKYNRALSMIQQRMRKREHKSISLDKIVSNYSLDKHYWKKKEMSSNDIFQPDSSSTIPRYLNSTFKSEFRFSKSLDHLVDYPQIEAVTTEGAQQVVQCPITTAVKQIKTSNLSTNRDLETSLTETEYSVGSSNISLLISEADYVKSRRNYRRVNRSNKHLEQQSNASSTTHIYESLDDLLLNNNKRNNFSKKIALQNEIIQQSSKAAKVCRTQCELIGEETLIEAEKILLVAGIRKYAIEDELKKLDYEEVDSLLTSCTVKIHNITLYDSGSTKNNVNSNRHYVCVVHHGSTVYATKTTVQTENTISFPDEFLFSNIPSDFQINLSVYALLLKKKKNKNFRHKLREDLKSVTSLTESCFALWGTAVFKPSQARQTIYRLSKVPLEASIINSFTANVHTSYRIHVTQSGFLTLGVEYKGYPVWSRRWCVLNGYILKYWFLPNEQDTCPSLGEINLKNCVSNEIKRADKDVCFNSTTLVLLMNVSDGGKKSQRKYFLSADNYVEFDKWLREFNVVLYYLRKWAQYSKSI